MSINKVILQGRLTRDPELKYTQSGTAVATFTIAVNRRFKKEGQPEADFVNCVVWQKAAESAANHVGKGCRVGVVGRWETRNYDGQDGKRVYVNECIVEEMDFIDFANQNDGNAQQRAGINTSGGGGNQNNAGGQQSRQNGNPFAGNGQIDISDDDLPF
jgi:single-strand DNA-binding protein